MPFRLLRRTFGRVVSFAELPTSAAQILRTGYSTRCAAAVMLLSSFASLPASAQVVRGTVTERGTSRPLAGVLLSVLDERDSVAVATLSSEGGDFELRAPRAGRYVLEAKRIGLRQVRFPAFGLTDGETVRHDVVLDPIPQLLGRIEVRGRSGCVERPQENVRTAALWEDARAALRATVLTRQGAVATDSVMRFTRKLDVNTWQVLFEQRQKILTPSDRPFRSLPAEDLSASGYVHVSHDGTATYYAPDAEVLLSDRFLADHCFSVRRGEGAHARDVGLAFQPVRGRTTPDIRGVLWLDMATAELRALDFTYTWLPFEARTGDYGGSVSFFRTPAGRWIVWNWRIRTPEFGFERWTQNAAGERIPLTRGTTPRIVRVQEEGGAVPIGALLFESGDVQGVVLVDSVNQQAIAGATVTLRGTTDSAVTDGNGAFVLSGVLPGSYSIGLRHPALDSLGVEHLGPSVDVVRGGTSLVRVYFPDAADLSMMLCADTLKLDQAAIIRFIAVDSATDAPLRDAPVRVMRRKRVFVDSVPIDSGATIYEGTLDDQGSFVACGIPAGEWLHIESTDPGPPWNSVARSTAGVIGWQLIRVRRPDP